ncbi:hypothetical protein JTB14_031233 [Gonioctena quinquepunctata]|nr:hypothetical protein JTB14_031233 [Gonioctena quinquepunctata]
MGLVQKLLKSLWKDAFGSKRTVKVFHTEQAWKSRRNPIEQLLKGWQEDEDETQSDESDGNVIRGFRTGTSGANILADIFGRHQGVVNDDAFQEILQHVAVHDESRELDNSILEETVWSDLVNNFWMGAGASNFLSSATKEEQREKTGLNELRNVIFHEKPQISLYLFKGVPFAYRYTDVLPNSGLDQEVLQIMGDSQGKNLELVSFQQMMTDPEFQPALRQYLRRSHLSTHTQSTQHQKFQELLEQLRQNQWKQSQQQWNPQQRQVVTVTRGAIPVTIEDMLKEKLQNWAQKNLAADDQDQFQKILQENRRVTQQDVDEEMQEMISEMVGKHTIVEEADPWEQVPFW